MPKISASVSALLISVVLMWTANGLFITLIGIRMVSEGFSATWTGIIASAYFGGQFIGALVCGRIIERVGHVRAFAVFASLVSACAIGHPLMVDPVFWAILRLLTGVCVAGALMVAESWLNGSSANDQRGSLLAIYTTLQYLALSGGQYLLTLEAPTTFILFSVASILFSLALVPLSMARSATAGEVAPSRLGIRELFEISPLGVIGSFGAGVLAGAVLGMGPIFAAGIGLTNAETATFMSMIIFGGLIIQYPVGKASDLLDRRTVITGALFLSGGLAFATSLYFDVDMTTLFILVGLFGGVSFSIYPLAVAHANDFIEAEDLVAASGGLLLAFGLGAALGPLAASFAIAQVGPGGLFQFCAGICVAIGVFALYRMSRRAAPAAEDQGPYVLVSRTTAAAGEMDPRVDPEFGEDGPSEDGPSEDVGTA